jgi:hypothetical protein
VGDKHSLCYADREPKTDFLHPGEKNKNHLRVKTHHKCLDVTFPALCRTDAACRIVMPLCRDQRVFSGCWCFLRGLFSAFSVSRDYLLNWNELGRNRSRLTDLFTRYLCGGIERLVKTAQNLRISTDSVEIRTRKF